MNKNILFIIDSLGAGGAEKAVLTLARTMVNLGHVVTIIIADDNIEYEIDFSINIRSLHFQKSRWEATYHKFGRKLSAQVKELESKFGRFDLITTHLQKAHRLTSSAKINKAYYCIHSTISQASLAGRSGLRLFFKRRKLKSLLNGKDIITVSKGIQEDLIRNVGINPKTIRTIYNPLDFELIKKLSLLPNPYEKENYIIHIGRLTSSKRHDILLQAYVKSNIKEKLLLLGDGPLKQEILQTANNLGVSSKVIFAGFHQNPYPIIKHAKLNVLSSDYEGLPTSLLESLALNVLSISTDCPSGPREILTNSLEKYLVPVGNSDKLASAIRMALNDLDDNNTDIPPSVLNKFDMNNVSNQYLNLP
ncbi:glycosyltransferase [Kaarinaea lacus]